MSPKLAAVRTGMTPCLVTGLFPAGSLAIVHACVKHAHTRADEACGLAIDESNDRPTQRVCAEVESEYKFAMIKSGHESPLTSI
jgi:hypothetical protein